MPGEVNNLGPERSAVGCVLTTDMHMIEVVRAIRSARIQLCLGSFRMKTFVLLPLHESKAQRSAGKHDQW